MKIGTLILVIVLILIAFGFSLSDSIHARQDLSEVKEHLNGLTVELDQSNSELVACQSGRSQDAQIILDLKEEIEILQDENLRLNLTKQQNSLGDPEMNQAQNSVVDFLMNNPVALLLVVIAQFLNSTLRSGKVLGLTLPGWKHHSDKEYVRLSREELSWIIQRRRSKINQKEKR